MIEIPGDDFVKYENIEDVGLKRDEKISLQTINKCLERMVENDNQFNSEFNCAPTIWERSWYNMQLDESVAQEYGYKRGDAVWINTEEPGEFAAMRADEIRGYVLDNDVLREKYYEISASQGDLVEFYKDVIQGTADGSGKQLYYLGDITQKVQIRVSLSSSNTELPSNDRYWKDFFPTNNEDKMRLSVMEELKSQMDSSLSSHIQNYHLGNLSSVNDIRQMYADRNLGNLVNSAYQRYSKYHSSQLNGKFDFVKTFHKKDYGQTDGVKLCKWYRLWNSGYLEHGGVVDCSDPSKTGDSFYYGRSCIRIQLDFEDSVPVYTYSTVGLEPFYSLDKNISVDGDSYKYKNVDDINRNDRYSVTVTQIGL